MALVRSVSGDDGGARPSRRRLAAIVCLDTVGYSRRMHEDEGATHETFRSCWERILLPAVSGHNGRIVKSTGDGFVAEFQSVLGAVECSVAIQDEATRRNKRVPPEQRILFRVGVSAGEIIVESDDVYGDRVNLAARLEAMADPGGICVSGIVYDEVKGKLPIGFKNVGRRKIKNLPERIRVHHVVPQAPGQSRVGARPYAARLRMAIGGGRRVMALAVGLPLLVAALALTRDDWSPMLRSLSEDATEAFRPALPLPERPSIAILAFQNLVSDPNQDYFADGIAEDIITDLSRLSGLFVIDSNSSFQYRSGTESLKEVGQELGVQYVLKGSVRRQHDMVRVTAQLVDTKTGYHVWAERYDRKLSDVFGIQADIARSVVTALASRLVDTRTRELAQGTHNIEAYDAFLKGWSRLRVSTAKYDVAAVAHLKTAIAIDPDFARAHAALASAYLMATRMLRHRSLGFRSEYDTEALAFRHIELAMRQPSALAFRVRAELHFRDGRYEAALDDLAQAEARTPNDAAAAALYGRLYLKLGRPYDAVASLRAAMRLDPNRPLYRALLGIAEFARGNFADSAKLLEASLERDPDDFAHLDHLIAAYAYLGRIDEARALLTRMTALREKAHAERYTLFVAGRSLYYDNDCDLFRLREGLRKVGVPEGAIWEPEISGANCVLAPHR